MEMKHFPAEDWIFDSYEYTEVLPENSRAFHQSLSFKVGINPLDLHFLKSYAILIAVDTI